MILAVRALTFDPRFLSYTRRLVLAVDVPNMVVGNYYSHEHAKLHLPTNNTQTTKKGSLVKRGAFY
jgi:hypothetical protein